MGKIEIDHTGSGGGITLSSDGTSLLLGGTAIGGSALELYVENPSTPTTPLAGGTNGVAIGSNTNAGGVSSIALGSGSAAGDYAFAAQIGGGSTSYGAVGNYSIAMGQNARASDTNATGIGYLAWAQASESTSIGPYTDAGSYRSTAIGYNAQGYGTDAVALGNSRAGGTNSFAAVIGNNTSSYGAGGTDSIAIGKNAKTGNNTAAIAIGEAANITGTGYRSIAIGNNAQAGPLYDAVALGTRTTASSLYSFALGYWSTSLTRGKYAYASGRFNSAGDAQTGMYVLRSDTTDATAEALTTENATASTANQVNLPNNSAYAFHGTIVARESATDGTDCAAWKVEGLIRREGSAGTTTLVNSATTVLDNTPSWGMALSADTTNGGLAITVTGAASTNIRWVATIHTSEVTYA